MNNATTRELGMLYSLAVMGAANLHEPTNSRVPTLKDIKNVRAKPIPKGCKRFVIGRYIVVALNRKNAIRKALKLRKQYNHED